MQATESLTPAIYLRVQPSQRPACRICPGQQMTAGSTQGKITYYYCELCGSSDKVIRTTQDETDDAFR